MRKLILEEWMSLDGYISDKNDQLDFLQMLPRSKINTQIRSS